MHPRQHFSWTITHSIVDGWIESNIQYFTDHYLARETSTQLLIGRQQRMATIFYDQTTPPSYPYLCATSAYSALVQLYARSGQLGVADRLHRRNKIISNYCRFGCGEVEDEHHIFVSCKRYKEWRSQSASYVYEKTKRKLDEAKLEDADSTLILEAAKSLFSDNIAAKLLVLLSRTYPEPRRTTPCQYGQHEFSGLGLASHIILHKIGTGRAHA
jgi:hypothetical protein